MTKNIFFLFLAAFFLFSGCAKSKIVNNPDAPYESLGSLELKVSKHYSAIKYLTFGIMRQRSFDSMTHELNKSLSKLARDKYGADAVANITYWPESNSSAQTDYLYGRGEMIRFKKFPATEFSTQTDQKGSASAG